MSESWREDIVDALKRDAGITASVAKQDGVELTYMLDLSRIEKDRSKVVEEAKDLIGKRVAASGFKGISVAVEGEDRIVIQVPGTETRWVGELKALIEKVGNLTFRLFAPAEHQTEERRKQIAEEERAFIEADRAWVEKKVADPSFHQRRPQPPAHILRVEVEKMNVGGREEFRPNLMKQRVLDNKYRYNEKTNVWEPEGVVSGRYLSAVGYTVDQQTFKPAVSFQFRDEGARLFGDLTSSNIGLLLVLQNEAHDLPARELLDASNGDVPGSRPAAAKFLVGSFLRKFRRENLPQTCAQAFGLESLSACLFPSA